jgi:hypothetical protein
MVLNWTALLVRSIAHTNGASISCFHSQYAVCFEPWPTRKATL